MTLSILLIPPSTFPFLTFFSASFFLSFRPFFLTLFYNLIFLTCRLCLFPFFLPSFLLASSLFRFSATIPPSFRSYLAYIFLPSFLPSLLSSFLLSCRLTFISCFVPCLFPPILPWFIYSYLSSSIHFCLILVKFLYLFFLLSPFVPPRLSIFRFFVSFPL